MEVFFALSQIPKKKKKSMFWIAGDKNGMCMGGNLDLFKRELSKPIKFSKKPTKREILKHLPK